MGEGDLLEFVDYMRYERGWLATSIKSAIGGLRTVFALLGWPPLPRDLKLLQLQIKGIAKQQPTKGVGHAVTPGMWLAQWD